ncbi:ThiF family adenylyltransferase [Azospirillum sp.]|uniref:ThiF family adenylyltransferase n=1 Tax=Azospirillum sp. TaxID=34012 RepID=UPI003D743411
MMLVSPEYPKGEITFYPATDGGISVTFPHQTYNGEPKDKRPWRTGNLCVAGPRFDEGVKEPKEADSRLRWHASRLLAWINAAATDTLLAPGQPTEFPSPPSYKDGPPGIVVFAEDRNTFEAWQGHVPGGGLVTLVNPTNAPGLWAVQHFRDTQGNTIRETSWGLRMAGAKGRKPITGMWFTLPDPPTVLPWGLPATWGEMEDAFRRVADVSVFNSIIENGKLFRTGQRHPILIGFPTAELVGEQPVRLHWEAVWMPVLSHGAVTAKGFRSNERGYRQRDRTLIRADARVEWMPIENWAPDQLITRGTTLDRNAADQPILLLGAGALGSAVGVALSRAGAHDIMVMDHDLLIGGNLVRHELGVGDVCRNKAERLALRMNDVNPHAKAVGVPLAFPVGMKGRHERRAQASRVVIDCTGTDKVLDDLAGFAWDGVEDRWFISLSLGWGARRLFCFASKGTGFPIADFKEHLEEWRGPENATKREVGAPSWEGVGCWHPVFPADGLTTSAMALAAVKFISRVLAGRTPERVFEVHTEHVNVLASEEEGRAAA